MRKKVIDIWVILSIFIILILIAINIPYTTAEPYTEKEFYTETEPYTATQTYYEKESYTENIPLNNYTTSGWYLTDDRINDEFDLKVSVKNTGNASGEFWITFHVKSTNGSFDVTTNRTFLMPNGSYQFKQTFAGRFSYTSYKVYQTTREVTKYRDVPKERDITAYRDIEKSRDAVKQREIKLSLIERILEDKNLW
ncbi:MAG: hypothetical protein OIN66_01555 [Candidatus Methanoperedens sp.]|nr:hypothetical protein [Candidatus Methanoperedens sp.]